MVKYREILRLAQMGVSQDSIAFSCKCAQSTVSNVLRAAKAHKVSWPLPEELDDEAIRSLIYPAKTRKAKDKATIDHDHIASELTKRGMTMSLLWNEYCDNALAQNKEPYMYSAFCKEHQKWAKSHDVRMHIEHKPAKSIQVDWVGDTGEVIDPDTGEMLKVYVFVACLPYSNYLYAEGFFKTNEEARVNAHIHAFSFFGGVTPIVVPDNCKTAISKNTKDALIVNEQYRRMSEYYGFAVVPARVRKPRDKGSVEMGVGLIERQALLPMRKRRFTSLCEFNSVLSNQIDTINSRPFQKREGSRKSIFLNQEQPMLIPLPPNPYEMSTRKELTVNFNYHISFDGAWYSVPFQYVRRQVNVVGTSKSVSIFCDGKRIAIHERAFYKGSYKTNPDHMPDAHRDYVEWNGDRFRKWAAEIGKSALQVIDGILKSRKIEQQSYRSCRAVLALCKTHGQELLEEACAKALLRTPRPSYKTIKDTIGALTKQHDEAGSDSGAYLRGEKYYKHLDIDNNNKTKGE